MEIFLCWSGKASLAIAEALHAFLGDTIQQLKPFLSSENIRKGGRWRDEIGQRLASCNYGILCFTKDSLKSHWMIFEAGALSKLPKSGVTGVLAGVRATEIEEPLSQFQHTGISPEEIFRLLADINHQLPEESRLDTERLKRSFERNWPELENKFAAALKLSDSEPPAPKRDSNSMIAETLELVREIRRGVDFSKLAASLASGTSGAPVFGETQSVLSGLAHPAYPYVSGLAGKIILSTKPPVPTAGTAPTGPIGPADPQKTKQRKGRKEP